MQVRSSCPSNVQVRPTVDIWGENAARKSYQMIASHILLWIASTDLKWRPFLDPNFSLLPLPPYATSFPITAIKRIESYWTKVSLSSFHSFTLGFLW